MFTLLGIIYLAFISLGLPDAIHGAAWPAVSMDLGVDISMVGLLSLVTSAGTIASSLMSNKLINKFGTGAVMVASVSLTALGIMLTSVAPTIWVVMLLAVPMGIGGGCVDAALNNFVALHYKANHMNWLHCFWGIGATSGPLIMAAYLATPSGWRDGYRVIGWLQIALVVALAFSLPMWSKVAGTSGKESDSRLYVSNSQVIKVPGAMLTLMCFFCMVGFEGSAGTWISSYLVEIRGVGAQSAARLSAMFFIGTTVGRLISGLIAMKVKSDVLIRIGLGVAFVAAIVILLPLPVEFTIAGFMMLGLGNAPIYPSMMHETPRRFGPGASQAMAGLSVASAYISSISLPPLQGLLSRFFTLRVVPWSILVLILMAMALNERLRRKVPGNAY